MKEFCQTVFNTFFTFFQKFRQLCCCYKRALVLSVADQHVGRCLLEVRVRFSISRKNWDRFVNKFFNCTSPWGVPLEGSPFKIYLNFWQIILQLTKKNTHSDQIWLKIRENWFQRKFSTKFRKMTKSNETESLLQKKPGEVYGTIEQNEQQRPVETVSGSFDRSLKHFIFLILIFWIRVFCAIWVQRRYKSNFWEFWNKTDDGWLVVVQIH